MITVVIRPSNIYGPLDDYDFATSHVMAAMIRKVAERHNPIIMWGDGNDIRDLIYIDDFIDAVILAAEKVNTYDPINIGAGIGNRLIEILQMIMKTDNYNDAVIKYDTSKPSMIPVRLIDIAKAEKTIGFSPKIGLRDGIGRTLQWYRGKYDLANQRQ
jgi:GDP-L-fucose synthase